MARQIIRPELGLLRESVCLARAVIRAGETGAVLTFPANLWLFASFAKVASAGSSVQLLIERRRYWDAKLVLRALYDGVVDIVYILTHPQRNTLMRLLRIETAIDAFDELKEVAKARNVSVCMLPRTPQVVELVGEYKHAINDPAFSSKSGDWPKRWIRISRKEKLGSIKQYLPKSWLDLFDYTIGVLGNAAAHSRCPAISAYIKENTHGKVTFSHTGRMPKPRSRVLLALEPFACLLGTSIFITERFHLDSTLLDRADRLRQRWDTLVVGS